MATQAPIPPQDEQRPRERLHGESTHPTHPARLLSSLSHEWLSYIYRERFWFLEKEAEFLPSVQKAGARNTCLTLAVISSA
jgi:hypothetical protein